MTFEDKLKELEKIVTSLEKGDCQLDEAMQLFEQGVALSKACNAQLEQARQKIVSIDDTEESEVQQND